MTLDVVFISRSGSTPSGKEWDAFMAEQTAVLTQRAGDGWDLATVLDVVAPSAMREATRTAGVLLYFRKA